MPTQKGNGLKTVRFVYSSLAQSVEHAAVNRRVVCSSQTGGAKEEKNCPEGGSFLLCFSIWFLQATLCFGRQIAAVCTTLCVVRCRGRLFEPDRERKRRKNSIRMEFFLANKFSRENFYHCVGILLELV